MFGAASSGGFVRRPRQLRFSWLSALFTACVSGLCSGASVVAGYVTGLEDRLVAVLCLVSATSLLIATPVFLGQIKKNDGYIEITNL
jgi:hypothetical protein